MLLNNFLTKPEGQNELGKDEDEEEERVLLEKLLKVPSSCVCLLNGLRLR